MRIKMANAALKRRLDQLGDYIGSSYPLVATRFVRLGSRMLRVLVHDAEFVPQIDRQLAWALKPEQEHWDSTLVVWKEPAIARLEMDFVGRDIALKARMRIEALCLKCGVVDLEVMDDDFSHWNPALFFHPGRGFVEGVDQSTGTYYYGVRDPEPEALIREGHIFVQFVNQVVKSPMANLVHGACIGRGGAGFLLCGTGHRGKSTLTVLALLNGFEYVSDDYQILEREVDGLYAYPFYSIITLAPTMYNEMYEEFRGKFVSMNARKDKYVFSVAPYHGQFRDRYPIRACLFPEIVGDPDPGIEVCSPQDRSRAIAQLVGSTIRQMRDAHDPRTIKKLVDMIKDYPFYKLRLCRDIRRNVECLANWIDGGAGTKTI